MRFKEFLESNRIPPISEADFDVSVTEDGDIVVEIKDASKGNEFCQKTIRGLAEDYVNSINYENAEFQLFTLASKFNFFPILNLTHARWARNGITIRRAPLLATMHDDEELKRAITDATAPLDKFLNEVKASLSRVIVSINHHINYLNNGDETGDIPF
jgi:hypothetical protein